MADRVHPMDIASTSSNPPSSNNSGEVIGSPRKPSYPSPAKPVPPPPPGTYVVQVPKDQIYKYPPPENSRRYESLTKRKPRRSCCCRCLCFTFSVILILIISLGITAGVLYLVYRPEAPKYNISSMTIKNFNVTASATISPEFNISVRAENPNNKLGIYYRKGSSVTVIYSDVDLSTGILPAFYQQANNVTVFQTVLKGSNVMLGSTVKSTLRNEVRKGKVPFRVNIKAPVKIKIGAIKTWEITVKVNCDVTVDALTVKSKLVSKDCDYSVRLW
ncbi:NDR1/HIN1-like protein 13 [Lycium barbarum]|uniref:NDR1/HIN1-like protein 13 n=1 Tax=Lycium barbarum TaxID=112863 RepID=UPI00293F5A4D|nr:NDR1/HIN1-like protein 13 [Lycium barbarum]XP_060197107.1 NDR1/HIN1-like protein 13 [Lycium barbarum]